ncbi:MAG: hypothetical protein MUP66_00940 [Candidatus Nanohaloarchaeota archaeon QJJ-5]|nr:hypothetical protein [Candidatus Nanohaloarchaeota archaeon QJJ-5]
MGETGSNWDEQEGYSFVHEEGDVDISPDTEETDSDPVVRNSLDIERMHHSFPETHDYLKQSLQDIDFITDRIRAMETEDDTSEKQVTIKRREKQRPNPTIDEQQLASNRAFKKRRIKTRAINRVKDHMREKGYSESFLDEHQDYIEEKVEDLLGL